MSELRRRDNRLRTAPPELRDFARAVVAEHGVPAAAKRLHTSPDALRRLLLGEPVMPGTISSVLLARRELGHPPLARAELDAALGLIA